MASKIWYQQPSWCQLTSWWIFSRQTWDSNGQPSGGWLASLTAAPVGKVRKGCIEQVLTVGMFCSLETYHYIPGTMIIITRDNSFLAKKTWQNGNLFTSVLLDLCPLGCIVNTSKSWACVYSTTTAPCTALIQRGWVKCRRHISVESILLYNWLGIPFPFHIIITRLY